MTALVMPAQRTFIPAERCERCSHAAPASNPTPGVPQLECRRFPPQVVAAAPGQLVALFPLVDPTAHCGEWRVKFDA